jgi:hypothetical protein
MAMTTSNSISVKARKRPWCWRFGVNKADIKALTALSPELARVLLFQSDGHLNRGRATRKGLSRKVVHSLIAVW